MLLTAGLMAAGALRAGPNESASLAATVMAGPLEIGTSSVDLAYSVSGFSVGATEQRDAVAFLIEGLVVNDLNQDGLGWRLTANPEALAREGWTLPLGDYAGFSGYEALPGLSQPDRDELVCVDGGGVAGFRCDYAVSYHIPAFAAAGVYSGTVRFSIVAE